MVNIPHDFPVRTVREYVSLAEITSMRCGGKVALAAYPETAEEMAAALRWLLRRQLLFRVQGRMTNTLPPDGLYDGVMLFTDRMRSCTVSDGTVTLDAGCIVTAKAISFAGQGISLFGGMETVPGTVGGAVRGNAGAYGAQTSDSLLAATVFCASDGKIRTFSPADMRFGYRDSILRHEPLYLLSATFRVRYGDRKSLLAAVREQQAKRRASQPLTQPSLGSFFLKSGDVPAACYIEGAGCKGLRVGSAEVSRKHAGFIVNTGGASSSDVRELASEIKRRVLSRYGVSLICEPDMIPETSERKE